MPVTNYYTVGKRILSEKGVNGRLTYLFDGLGSTIRTADQTSTTTFTSRYKPYGASLTQTGTATRFKWVGTGENSSTGRSSSEFYVRARHYTSGLASWTSGDPYWPEEQPPYRYCYNNPVSYVDPSGMQGQPSCRCRFKY